MEKNQLHILDIAQRSCGCLTPGGIQGQVGRALGNLIWWKLYPILGSGLEVDGLKGPFSIL